VRVSFLEGASTRSRPPEGVLVPSAAIVERDGRSVVFAIDGTHAHSQPVTAGQTYGDLRLVSGIAEGTHLVRNPPERLHDGDAIVLASP